jgi:hypothetical protein
MLHSDHVPQSLRSSGLNVGVMLVFFYELWGSRLVLIRQNSFSHMVKTIFLSTLIYQVIVIEAVPSIIGQTSLPDVTTAVVIVLSTRVSK